MHAPLLAHLHLELAAVELDEHARRPRGERRNSGQQNNLKTHFNFPKQSNPGDGS